MNAIQAKNADHRFPSNPGYLKLLLSSKGMRIGKSIADELGKTLKTRRGAAGGVELILPGGVWVDVPIEEAFTEASPLSLEKEGSGFYVTAYGESTPVDIVPQPSFYNKITSKGTPFYQVASLHGGEVHITPSGKCQFFDLNASCLFCQEREAFFPIAREFITVAYPTDGHNWIDAHGRQLSTQAFNMCVNTSVSNVQTVEIDTT